MRVLGVARSQLGIHNKPIGLLNVKGYFSPMVAWIDHAVQEGFIDARFRACFVVAQDAATLYQALRNHKPPVGLTPAWHKPDKAPSDIL